MWKWGVDHTVGNLEFFWGVGRGHIAQCHSGCSGPAGLPEGDGSYQGWASSPLES